MCFTYMLTTLLLTYSDAAVLDQITTCCCRERCQTPPRHARVPGATVRFVTPRYEYRVWAPDLTELAARVAMHCEPLATRLSEEFYLLPLRTDLNIKIRSGTLDIKQLMKTQQGFELWAPVLKEAFPLSASSAAEVTTYLDRTQPSPAGDEPLAVDDFLARAERAGAATATVTKRRQGFLHEACILEFAEVTINGFGVHTVAVEGEDLDSAVAVAARLGIDELPNKSYPQEIRHALRVR